MVVGDDPEKFFQVETQMPLLEKEQLVDFLRKNVNVFAWNAYEIHYVFGHQFALHNHVINIDFDVFA